MQALLETPARAPDRAPSPLPPLQNGDRLSAAEFLRRYRAMPDLKKAELIHGEVYLTASPVRVDQHGDPDALVQTWIGTYAAFTPGVKHATNTTTRFDADNMPQPDASLRLLPEYGGQARVGTDGYLVGAPELVVEVAASSSSIDAGKKLHTYRRAGVQEYVVWRTLDGEVDWWFMHDDEYVRLSPEADGTLRSRLFPGLWLDPVALINEDAARVLTVANQGVASEEHAVFLQKLAAQRQG